MTIVLLLHEQSSSFQEISEALIVSTQQQGRHNDCSPQRPTLLLPLPKLSHECRNSNRTTLQSHHRHRWQNFYDHTYVTHILLHNHDEPKRIRRMRNINTISSTTTASAQHRTRLSFPARILFLMMMMIHSKNFCIVNATSSSSSSSSLSTSTTTFLRQSRQTSSTPTQRELQHHHHHHRRTMGMTHPTRRQQQQPPQQFNPDRRTILVIRILDTPEDSNTTIDRHNTLREVLFDGGGDVTLPSVQQQMKDCSGSAIIFVPQIIPDMNNDNNNDKTFIVDIVVNPNLITNQSDRNEWVEVMASIACDINNGPLRNLIGTNGSSSSSSSNNGNVFTLEPDDDFYYTSILRQVADHVIVLLPGIYPDADFIATAEINNRISMYAVPWGTSLSTYMHELAHNLGLRHAGDTIYSSIELDREYGDSSGYMGESMMTAWAPQKCYNAAQHWQLGWFGGTSNGGQVGSLRLSLSDTMDTTTDAPSLPLRIQVAAFVDYMNLISNTYDESFVILIQVTSNIYLEYNGAKTYNIGTDVAYANRIVIIEQDSELLSTTVLASLQSGESYALNTNRVIQVCDIIISDVGAWSSDVIDFATIAISDSHTTSTITSVCQDGPDYVVIPSASSPITSTPTEPPTANTMVVAPSMAPVAIEMTPEPTAKVVEETPLPTIMPTVRVGDDSNTDDSIDESQHPTRAPIVDDVDEDAKNNVPTSVPTKPLSLRGPTTSSTNNNSDTNTTARTDESSTGNGLPTSSIIYSVFGTIMGAILISIVVLFYLTRHSKYERQNAISRQQRPPSTRPKSAASRSKRQSEQQYVVSNGSSRTMKSPDGSPTTRRSDKEHRAKDDVEERSKSTVPSATTRSSSQQKPKLVLEKQRQPAVTTTCFHKSNKNQKDNDIVNDEDDSSDDDDQSDTLSVILQQEIWKDKVHKILQSVFFVQDKDGTVTQMMPVATTTTATEATSIVQQPEAVQKR